MSTNDTPQCSMSMCINPSVHDEVTEGECWRFTVHYCREHHREIQQGTPLGPLGLDAAHVTIEPVGTTEMRVPSNQASPVG